MSKLIFDMSDENFIVYRKVEYGKNQYYAMDKETGCILPVKRVKIVKFEEFDLNVIGHFEELYTDNYLIFGNDPYGNFKWYAKS